MSDSVTTRLDAPYAQQPETRAAAVRALVRLGAADLLDMLGLVDVPERDLQACPVCGHRRESDGRPCRRRTCEAGSKRRAMGGP
jgi:hypothetical protein